MSDKPRPHSHFEEDKVYGGLLSSYRRYATGSLKSFAREYENGKFGRVPNGKRHTALLVELARRRLLGDELG